MNIISKNIRKKGLTEFAYLSLITTFRALNSILRIFILRLRSYNIDYSVHLQSNTLFFQTERKSITIGRGTYIGNGVRIKVGFKGKIFIGKDALIDDYSILDSQSKISIGNGTLIAPQVYIIDYNHMYPLSKSRRHLLRQEGYESKPITIGKNVWIGTHVVILRGVTIGDDAVIGAGAIVTKNVPSHCVAVGNPARILKRQRVLRKSR